MTRHQRVGAAVVLFVAGGAALWWLLLSKPDPAGFSGQTATPRPRPNIVLISLDTLRPDHLGCYGYKKSTSPNLDRFAKDAVVFTNCRCQAPWTLPSHMSLFTSMLPSDNGVDSVDKVLPRGLTTLAEVLQAQGYRTHALVNNAQMMKHWGFSRGFKDGDWQEFPADTPAGNCENITAEAMKWLKTNAADYPFFLLLHYFNAHDPYHAPESFRKRLGTTLTKAQASALTRRYRGPEENLRDPALMADLQAAYDAGIAWLDDELGKLFAALPPDTLVVIFSDHGEAFEEHGWMMHGATLYDEEIRVALIVRPPGPPPSQKIVTASVMLMDVAPTILAQCNLRPPVQYQGTDLGPLWSGGRLPERLIRSETKAPLDGQYRLSVVLYPLKGIYSLFDGRFEMYRLPDEQKALTHRDPIAADALRRPLREWMDREQYWMIHAVGQGDFEAEIELPEGGLGQFILVGCDSKGDRDSFEINDRRILKWRVYPGKGGVKSLFLQPARPDSGLHIHCWHNGTDAPTLVYLGKDRLNPPTMPFAVKANLDPVSPFIERPFTAAKDGFYVMRHRTPGSRPRPSQVQPLNEQTIRLLRSLGYVQ